MTARDPFTLWRTAVRATYASSSHEEWEAGRKALDELAQRLNTAESSLRHIIMAEPKEANDGTAYWPSFAGTLQNIAATGLKRTTP